MSGGVRRTRRLLTIEQAADFAEVVPRTILRKIADGTLTDYRIGDGFSRVDLAELGEQPIASIGGNDA